jgi:hypothetical protein
MVSQKLPDIHLHLPAPGNQSAGKAFVHGAAVFEVDLTAQPWASNRFIVVLFGQSITLPW